jgi:putative MATE family efflux protein
MTNNKIFQAIKQSLNGEELDYTTGSIKRAVFLLAIPMILELSLESVFALVDMFFVGKLGENAIATVGLTEASLTVIYSLAIGLSTAATAIVARRTGEKDMEGASYVGAQSLIIAASFIVLISLFGTLFAENILQAMGASNEVVAEGTSFTQIMMAGSGAIMLLFIINGIFRGAGNAAMAMKSLWIASLINIILCPLFIHSFGLKGAAIATVIGRSSGVLYQLYYLFYAKSSISIHFQKHFKPNFDLISHIIKVALPATIQFIIASGSWIILARLVASTDGTTASAGYQIAIRNVVFFILPAWGLSNAAATLVGQNLGAQKVERAQESVMITAKYNAYFMFFVTLIFIFFSRPIINFFSNDQEVINYGAKALSIIGTGYVFYGIGMVMTQALNGAGDTKTPTYINLICFWMIQVPLAYILADYFNLKSTGAFIAIPIAESLIAISAYYFFRKGNWKKVKV